MCSSRTATGWSCPRSPASPPKGCRFSILQDIPPVATGGPVGPRAAHLFRARRPTPTSIVKGSTPEFDYPKGKDNVYTTYDGAAGVAVGGIARQASSSPGISTIPNILLSRYITDESRILFRRNIQERVRTIAPFLRLDRDPYLVISEGRLFWMQDAYTTSSWFPYAQPASERDGELHSQFGQGRHRRLQRDRGLLRGGSLGPDRGDLPARSSPACSSRFAAMPPDLQKHIRYPEDLFLIQAQVYRAYHMDTPEVFYNREDLWQFPRQATDLDRSHATPGWPHTTSSCACPAKTRAEFFLMLPMVPSQRENMIAWLAARCDPPDYGKLIVYEFPKDKLVYGPFQIEARINQNTEISQQISLWNQMGSRVIRGQSSGGSDREFDLVRVAPVSPRGDRPTAGAQAGDRGLWRPCGHGGVRCPAHWRRSSRRPLQCPRLRTCGRKRRPQGLWIREPTRLSTTMTARSSG